jgi:hypothetical protein
LRFLPLLSSGWGARFCAARQHAIGRNTPLVVLNGRELAAIEKLSQRPLDAPPIHAAEALEEVEVHGPLAMLV